MVATAAISGPDYRIDEIGLSGARLAVDPAGILWWPAERLLAVADLHFEKASSFARHGALLPPFDTAATLARLCEAIMRYRPRTVLALGDSFHDGDGPLRLGDTDRDMIAALQQGRDWVWIAGNHDPDPAVGIGGVFTPELSVGSVTFRHEPRGQAGEIAGHLHPMARISARGRSVSRKCFAIDDERMVMPAFGAFTGGLNIRAAAFMTVFGALSFRAHMLGATRLYAVDAMRCLPD
ncbi:MAG: ligase-associated DNA damage response endonuclease PdeM [Pseudorhodoplanes sp.]|uniref:ligase-associated DNA damage response endonuclease PdeM n=1 Tax=Pseudorhodoplanes sp. TaxID=1934341 RepID=UPI003D1357E2